MVIYVVQPIIYAPCTWNRVIRVCSA